MTEQALAPLLEWTLSKDGPVQKPFEDLMEKTVVPSLVEVRHLVEAMSGLQTFGRGGGRSPAEAPGRFDGGAGSCEACPRGPYHGAVPNPRPPLHTHSLTPPLQVTTSALSTSIHFALDNEDVKRLARDSVKELLLSRLATLQAEVRLRARSPNPHLSVDVPGRPGKMGIGTREVT